MAENTLETETETRRAAIVRAERSIADAELIPDTSTHTNEAPAALRLALRAEKAVFAKLEKHRRQFRDPPSQYCESADRAMPSGRPIRSS